MKFIPNLKGLILNKDGSSSIEIEFISEFVKDPYAHTVILTGPDQRLWKVRLVEYEPSKPESGNESAPLPGMH